MATSTMRQFLLLLPPSPLSTPKTRKLRHVSTRSSSSSQTDCPVPLDQQPVNEYKSLSESVPFSWAAGNQFESRMFVSGAAFALAVGFPVAWVGSQAGTQLVLLFMIAFVVADGVLVAWVGSQAGMTQLGAETESVREVVGAVSSGLIFATVVVVRMYLGWAYVGNRLLSATVEYEETGWYDGQIWVKNAEVLARDRLLGSFSVKPVLSRLKNTLVVLAASLFVCAIMLINLESKQKNLYNISNEPGGRAVPGVYNDESARSFEPDAFCGEPDLQ